MSARSIGIVSGGGGPTSAGSVLQDIIVECQESHHCLKSYEYPPISFYSFPYSETMLTNGNSYLPSRELSHSIQQLKMLGMEIIAIPCFTMCSYLTYRHPDVELVEMGSVVLKFLKDNNLENPLILCSERTRESGYCEKHFSCRYPSYSIQREFNSLIEAALWGQKVSLVPILDKLPFVPIICASAIINTEMYPLKDPRLINTNKLLAEHVVSLSFERHFATV